MINKSLQQQLNDLTEKYLALQERANHLELENKEYQKELTNLSNKDNELELTLQELNRSQSQIQQRQSLLVTEHTKNVTMLEAESDINDQLKLSINENTLTINNLIKTNKTLKETNNKFESELKNKTEKMIKLENDYKTKIKQYKEKTAENQFLTTELQVLQSALGNQYKNALVSNTNNDLLTPEIKPLLPLNKTIDLLTPLANPLLAPKTIDYNYKSSNDIFTSKSPLQLQDVYSNENQMTFFAMNAVSRDNTLRSNPGIYNSEYSGSTIRSIDHDDNDDVVYNISIDQFDDNVGDNEEEIDGKHDENISYYRFKRYKQMSSRIIGINEQKEVESNNNEIIMEEMNKQRMEYEILLQTLNDENQALMGKLKVLNDEKKEWIEKYNKINENVMNKEDEMKNNELTKERNELLNKYKNLLETHNKCIERENTLNEKIKIIKKLYKKNKDLKDIIKGFTAEETTSGSKCYSIGTWW